MTETKKSNTEVGRFIEEMNMQLANEGVRKSLLATTFNNLKEEQMRKAILEGMIRGFTFKEFLQRDVYAIPFKEGYSLVTSIGHSRKLAASTRRYVGKTAPVFELDEKGNVISCEVTVKALVQGHVGEFTALVDFKEYSTGKNQWALRPKTMIAKVAEMHALRMAFPDELSNSFSEEEVEKENMETRAATAKDMVKDSNLKMADLNKNKQNENTQTVYEAEVKDQDESEDGTIGETTIGN